MAWTIKMTAEYYGPRTVESIIANPETIFNTEEEAQEWCDMMDDRPYMLEDGEASRPDYEPIDMDSEEYAQAMAKAMR